MRKADGLEWLERIYRRLLLDVLGWGEANWQAREDVVALIIKLHRESR